MIDHSDASIVIAEDQEQVDKILGHEGATPEGPVRHLQRPKGMRGYMDPHLLDFREVQNSGRDF